MKRLFGHVRRYVFRGLLAIIPIALTVFAVQFLYWVIDRRVMNWVDQILGFNLPGVGILLVGVVLYLIGFAASNVIGKKFFSLIERITVRMPLIKTTYQVGKQLAVSLSLPERQVFQRVVLVDYLKPGIWTVGFVTGALIDKGNRNEKLLKVFVPTPPNPMSGTMVVVKESDTRDPGWSVEEAVKCVISGGILGPAEIG